MTTTQPYQTTKVDGSMLDPNEWNQVATDIQTAIEKGVCRPVFTRMNAQTRVYCSEGYVCVEGLQAQGPYDSVSHNNIYPTPVDYALS